MTFRSVNIAAKDVRVGDRIYNSHAFHPSAEWPRVTGIEPLESGNLLITSTDFATVLHPEEGIAVIRDRTNQEKFRAALIDAYEDLFAHDASYTLTSRLNTPESHADKIIAGLIRGAAHKNGSGVKRACKAVGIKNTYEAIEEYLKGDLP